MKKQPISESYFSSVTEVISDVLCISSFFEVIKKQGSIPSVSNAMLSHRVQSCVDGNCMNPASAILRLLYWSFPARVLRSVVSVIVDATQAMVWRRFSTHIGEEVQIGIKPSLADSYAFSAPFVIAFIFFVVASVFHMCVSTIFGSLLITFAMYALVHVWHRDTFSMQTAAGLTLPFGEHSCSNGFFISAIAFYSPKTSANKSAGKVLIQNNPTPKPLANKMLQRLCHTGEQYNIHKG